MIKKLFLTLTAAALAAACLPFAAVAAGAEDNAEPVPYTVDFFSAEAAEQLIPVYIPTDGTGAREELSAHWEHDTSAGTLTRVNDLGTSDVTGSYASVFFKDCYLRYFELSVDVRIGQGGLEGVIFGNGNMGLRHMASGNGVYFMPDPCVEVKGLSISQATTSSKFGAKNDFYELKMAVCEEYFRVYVDGVLRIDTKYPAELIDYGRIGLFTANTAGAFGGEAVIYPLDAEGNRQDFEAAALVESIEADEELIEMNYADEPVRLGYTILPENCAEPSVRFLAENPDVATVDTNGYLHPLKEGTTVIKIITEDGGFVAETVVQIVKTKAEIAGVTLNVDTGTLKVGEKLYLEAGYYPADAENLGFKWSCSDTSVAIVNNGTVTALKQGECVVSVRDYYGNYKAECRIVVAGASLESGSEGGCKSVVGGGSAVGAAALAAACIAVARRRRKNG